MANDPSMFCIVVISVNALLMYQVFDIFVCCLCSLTGYAGMPINQRSERWELDNLFFEMSNQSVNSSL